MILLIGQFLDHRRRGLRCQFRGRSVDDGQNGFFLPGKEVIEGCLALAPGQTLGNELVDVGVDGEMVGGIDAAGETQKDRNANDLHGITGATNNSGDDRPLQHASSCPHQLLDEFERARDVLLDVSHRLFSNILGAFADGLGLAIGMPMKAAPAFGDDACYATSASVQGGGAI